MTYREKAKMEHPELVNENEIGGVRGCPSDLTGEDSPCAYPDKPICNDVCGACWDREIPGTENKKEEKTMAKTKVELLEELENKKNEVEELRKQIENLEKYKKYAEMADELKAVHSAFMNSGFSDEQAFEMLGKIFDGVIKSGMNRGLF